jgi:hypothetical protein
VQRCKNSNNLPSGKNRDLLNINTILGHINSNINTNLDSNKIVDITGRIILNNVSMIGAWLSN